MESSLNFNFLNGVISKVKSAGFDQAEAIGCSDMVTEMQVDAGDISQLRNTENIGLTLRGIASGRYATVSLNQLDDASVEKGVAKLKAAARSAPIDEARAFAPKLAMDPIVDGPAEPSLDRMYARLNSLLETASKKYPELKLEQVILKFERSRMLRANSLGLELDETHAHYSSGTMFTSKRGDKMSSFNGSGAVASDLEKDLINWGSTERLIESSIKEIDAAPFEGKFKGSVILTPDVVFDLMGSWFAHAGDLRMIADTSQLKGKIGERVASALLTIRVEPQSKEFAKHEYTTADGYKSEPSVLLDKGVLKTYMLSDYGARKTGLPRAANGFENRVIDAGTTALEEMIAKTERGLMLARISAGMPSANGDFSGVAKNSFLIENGKVTKPVSEIMVSGNLFDMMNSVSAVSRERVNDGGTLTPWIAVEGLTLAGS